MYNPYNYYSPNGSTTANSPVFLMSYPYSYDPFFMAPNTEVPIAAEETDQTRNANDGSGNEKAEIDVPNEERNQNEIEKKDEDEEGEEANVSFYLFLFT